MLATPGPLPSAEDDGWAYEVKWDGMRVLASSSRDGLTLLSRTGTPASTRFPEIAAWSPAAAGLPPDSILDGEVVAFDERGRPSFGLLAPRIQGVGTGGAPVTFVVFDLPRLGGVDLLAQPYRERRRLLHEVIGDAASVVAPEAFDDGAALLASTRAQGLEGVVAKRTTSPYRPGVRSPDWVKVPHRRTRSYVIGGWKRSTASSSTGRMASLLVGTPDPAGGLVYAGAVGSGLSMRETRALLPVLADIVRAEPAFAPTPHLPDPSRDGAVWVEPILVCDVEHLGRGGQGLLRQPTLVRLRPDLSVVDVAEATS
jgi:bifunctional non-homologous end joining protein LigD